LLCKIFEVLSLQTPRRTQMERHFDRWLPAGGLGPSIPVSTIPSQQRFGGLEMKLVKVRLLADADV
jgi:hypothetical protein